MTNTHFRLATSLSVSNLAAADSTATIDLGGAGTNLTVNEGGNTTFAGGMSNAGGLIKAGAGTLTLGGVNTYSGSTTVSNGTLLVDGSMASSACTVLTNTMLGGTGTVGAVTVVSGGILAPGHGGVGSLNSGAVELQAGSILAIQINSATPAANTLAASGVTIRDGVRLSLTDSDTTYLGGGTDYTLVSRSLGNDAEAFAGYPEGRMFLLGQNYFTITYKGGAGHDVVITSVKYEGSVYTIR
jgi:autotransporter-associated beta strand protein